MPAAIVKVITVIDNADNLLKAKLTGNAKIRGDRKPVFDPPGRAVCPSRVLVMVVAIQ